MTAAPVRRIAIVGGGVSGALTAVHLARIAPETIRVTLYERGGRAARGLAYDGTEPGHLLNVRTTNMSAFPDEPGHFDAWLDRQSDLTAAVARTAAGDFAPRAAYGRYLGQVLQDCCDHGGGCVAVVHDDVQAIDRTAGGLALRLASGRTAAHDGAVLAMGNMPERRAAEGPVFRNPWSPDAVRGLDPDAPVLILGTALTMIDVLIALRRHGFHGPVAALSRRGLTPQVHATAAPVPPPKLGPGEGVLALSRQLRAAVAAAEAGGSNWRAAIDALRPVTQAIWRAWPVAERARFLRHARPFWDIHRHRISPPVAAFLRDERSAGRLTVLRGHFTGTAPAAGGVTVAYREARTGAPRAVEVQRAILATGIPHLAASADPLSAGLIASGLARLDPLGIGLEVDGDLAVLDRAGGAGHGLWALGPIVRGVFWECTAVPDIRLQAKRLAEAIAARYAEAPVAQDATV